MPYIRMEGVSLAFPMLGASPTSKREDGSLESAGALIRAASGRSRAIMALSNIWLEINPGERVGLIGRNGSGKSTLLRTIGGIYEPLTGRLDVSGSVAGLYSVGLGMRGEASGHRNIELAGLVAGFSRAHIKELAPGIAEFTELGDYLDMPVRTYSNGMAMRLKFACATAFSPDILLMDEWLGAGDPDFQKKARARLSELVEQASILILASHHHGLIRDTCEKAAWLDRGELRAFGSTDEVIACVEGRMDPEDLSGLEGHLMLVTAGRAAEF